MKLGIHVPTFSLPGGPSAIAPTLVEVAREAEDLGCDHLTVMDHWFQMDAWAPATEPMLEGYTTLGFLAGQTSSIKLGLLVTGVTYRPPALLAKIIATLDVLSQGRAQLAIGAAWYEREHLGLGVPFPPVAERFELLEEAILIIERMWSDDDGAFETAHHQLAETICEPKPIQRPRPPIMIGGGGEKKTLRLVARYADACNISAGTPDAAAAKFAVLDAHCAAEGRDPASIERTVLWGGADPFADVSAFVDAAAELAAVGVEKIFVMPLTDDPLGWVETVAGGAAGPLAAL